jgi:hypothetical protein
MALIQATGVGRGARWAGRVVSAIPVLMMGMSGVFKLVGAFTDNPQLMQNWTHFGYPPSTLLPIGVLEIGCALVSVFPPTAVLGAVLVTGYLGGAIATHVRVSETYWIAPALLGVFAWLGLFLREPRLRALLPVRER